MINNNKIETWMFREKNEFFYLFVSITVVILLALIIAEINFYILLIGVLFGIFYIILQQAQLIGNALEINENQFPEIYAVFQEQKESLNINKARLYVIQDPNPNAFTIGFTSASIILASSLMENFSKEELIFTIAHELGHVKANHNIILSLISPLGNSVLGSSLIFSFWRRKAEYSCDKCGLILTKKLDHAITGLLKLSVGLNLAKKVNLESYKEQLINSKTGIVTMSEFLFDHPLTTNRINKLVGFWKKNFVYQ